MSRARWTRPIPTTLSRRGGRSTPHPLSASAAAGSGFDLETGSIVPSIGALGSGRTGGGVADPDPSGSLVVPALEGADAGEGDTRSPRSAVDGRVGSGGAEQPTTATAARTKGVHREVIALRSYGGWKACLHVALAQCSGMSPETAPTRR